MATNVGEFFKNFWDSFTQGLSDLGKTIGTFFDNLLKGISDFVKGLFNGFTTILDFFLHIFVPTEEQWDAIKEDYRDLGEVFKNKIPFVRTI